MNDEKGNNTEFTPEELKAHLEMLHTRVDEILFYKWDPIGVSDGNNARDEYTSYVDEVLEMALDGAAPERIANHLSLLCVNTIGLLYNKEIDKSVAELIYAIVHDHFYNPKLNVIEIE